MSSKRQTRQRLRNNEQNQEQDDSSVRTNQRALTYESHEDYPEVRINEQAGDGYVTPSATFIGGVNPGNNPEISAEKLTELGWSIYTFEEKNMKMKLHFDFLKTCLAEGIIPKGLIVNKSSAIGAEDETFRNKWKETLNNCSLKLMECLVEYYERQLAQNIANIAETHESLEKIEHWTNNDKSQLEEKICSILEPKEKELKEEKQKKLETARNQKSKVQIPQRGTGTYADVLKRHIREKLSPQDGNDTPRKPEQWGRVQRDRRQRYYNTRNLGIASNRKVGDSDHKVDIF